MWIRMWDSEVDGNMEQFTAIMAKETKDPWVDDPKGTLAIGKFFNTMLLTEDVSHHHGLPSKVTRSVLFEKIFNMLEFKCMTEDGNWEHEISSVKEVYEALIASTSTYFPASALARFTNKLGIVTV